MTGLCPGCAHVRFVESATGSRFLMCRLAKVDARFTKYPPQPVLRCAGFEEAPPCKESGT
mgnify:FL=1|jgi:hypothetical protein